MSVQIRKEAAASSAASAAAAVLPVSIKDHAATTTTPSSWASRIISREVLFVVSVLGVYACHLSFSLVQERVYAITHTITIDMHILLDLTISDATLIFVKNARSLGTSR